MIHHFQDCTESSSGGLYTTNFSDYMIVHLLDCTGSAMS